MKFGFIIPQNFGLSSADDIVDLAIAAEVKGFDSIWVNHHIFHAGYVLDRLGDKPYFDALTVLTYVAARTHSVELGTTVIVLPYLNPIVLAKSVSTLDVMSNGRVVLGVGVGSLPEESSALGSNYQTRGSYADESIEIMKELWTNKCPSYTGKNYSFSGVKFYPKPLQTPHPPILVGGQSKRAMIRAVKYGNGWHPIGLSPDQLKIRLETINEMLYKEGRDSKGFRISLRTELAITDTNDESSSNTSGPVDKLIEIISEYERLGVEEMVFSISTDDVPYIHGVIDRFTEEILPHF